MAIRVKHLIRLLKKRFLVVSNETLFNIVVSLTCTFFTLPGGILLTLLR
jgi:hypothetical protein